MTINNIQAKESTTSVASNLTENELNKWFDQRLDEKLTQREESKTPSMTIIATKGTMDWAYPPFILASTGAALGWDVSMFFTFYGLDLLKKDLGHLQVSALGNPAMPFKMPFGPKWLQNIDLNIPNVIMGNLPGFEKIATFMMKKTTENKGVASVQELRSLCIEADVKLVACQMTVSLFNHNQNDFIDEIEDWVGAASFLPTAQKADVSLFI